VVQSYFARSSSKSAAITNQPLLVSRKELVEAPRRFATSRSATTSRACQPGARPPGGGLMVWVSCPLLASNHAIREFEFHISPARSSSRPQVTVGSRGLERARVGPSSRWWRFCVDCRRRRRCRGWRRPASVVPRSGRTASEATGGRPSPQTPRRGGGAALGRRPQPRTRDRSSERNGNGGRHLMAASRGQPMRGSPHRPD
jgi:hypothetical protein